MGTPSIVQLIYNDFSLAESDTANLADQKIIVHTLETAEQAQIFRKVKGFDHRAKSRDNETGEKTPKVEPPNIVLNVTNGTVRTLELRIVMILGLAIQFGVLAYDGVLIHGPLPFLDSPKVPHYAYAWTFLGTTVMCLGTFICALVIETSTVEEVWEADLQAHPFLQIMCFQRSKVVSDQAFGSFKIFYPRKNMDEQKSCVRISRKRPNSSVREAWTLIGSFTAMSGFVLHFCGQVTAVRPI